MDGPDTELAYDLYFSGLKAQLARLARQIGVFAPLAAGPATAEAVAGACGCDVTGTRLLLDCLVSSGVLASRSGRYELGTTAAVFLVPGAPAYAGDVMDTFTEPATWEAIGASIGTGQRSAFEKEIDHAQDAWIESYSAGRLTSSRELWAAAGVDPRAADSFELLDVACGCAVKSLVLAQDNPRVRVTGVDRPLVLVAARDLALRMGVLERTEFLAADLLTADLGTDRFDGCLLGQVTHYLTAEQNRDLFARVRRALRAGGTLVIDVPMPVEPADGSGSELALLLWASGGTVHPYGQYRDSLLEAGFDDVRRVGERWLSATKPAG